MNVIKHTSLLLNLNLQIVFIALMAFAFFCLDSMTHLGIAEGVLYVLVVLATLPSHHKLFTMGSIWVSTVLIIAGFWTSPPGLEENYALVNRLLSILGVWVTGFMVLRNLSSSQKLRSLKDDLEKQFETQTVELKQQNDAMLNLLDDMERVKLQLEEKQARLNLFIDAFPSGMVMVDEQGQIILINEIIVNLFGYTKDEILGNHIEHLLPERFRNTHVAHRGEFMKNPHPRAIGTGRDLYARRKDGSEFPVEIGLNPLKSGDVTYILASLVDITERKLSEAMLVQQTRLLAFDAALSHIIIQGGDLQSMLQACTQAICDHLNAAFARVWLFSPNQQILELQASAGHFHHPENHHLGIPDGPFHAAGIANRKKPELTIAVIGNPRFPHQDWATQEGIVAYAGYPLLRGQDVLGVMDVFFKEPVPDSTANTLKLGGDRIAMAVDRYQIGRAHHQLSQQSERILNSAGEGIYEVDREGRSTFINPAGARMLGYQPEELIGLPMHLTVHHSKPDGSPYPIEDCLIHAALRNGSVQRVEDEIMWRKDGTAFPVEYISTPIRNENNQLSGAVVIFNDITNRKQAEHIIAARNQELVRSNEELDQFAYIASHDLKEPIRGIHNFAKILIEDYGKDFNQDAMNKCETLIRLSMRMENLVDSLLYFSRAGRTEMGMRDTDLDATIKDIMDSLVVLLTEENAVIDIPRPLPTINCDAVRTGEILLNLITNAIKYNDKPEKHVEIGYLQSEERVWDSRQIQPGIPVFYIKDNGIGIRAKHYKSVFRIFKRLHSQDKYGGGSGVGLTITKKLIERHGGDIWIESTVGEGTTFYFTLGGGSRHDQYAQSAHSTCGGQSGGL
ncbi:PAS domain S-box protein [Candidatus Nitrospira allomarina]|uniref:histidine kinase n=1 Tax=Candidatus Nitrospira allomarina TaxID=3020900 RepID=A0AA96G7Y2_9BACT|nr:PAS domain S-box protein [Candidatus Nitrospira allomarina]WNM56496.1 PAS domain S-box protein [Candidatus Nitrospira allomarina]